LIITTPNGAGLYNCLTKVLRGGPEDPPVADRQMGMGHIHLWTPQVLTRTLLMKGWCLGDLYFNHGRENELFARSWRKFGSLQHQAMIKTVQAVATLVPRLRGFFVMTARPL
jgi:hypothetical protein